MRDAENARSRSCDIAPTAAKTASPTNSSPTANVSAKVNPVSAATGSGGVNRVLRTSGAYALWPGAPSFGPGTSGPTGFEGLGSSGSGAAGPSEVSGTAGPGSGTAGCTGASGTTGVVGSWGVGTSRMPLMTTIR